MRAGKLRHKITVQKNTETQDANNVYIDGWSTRTSLWADIEIISSEPEGEEVGSQSTVAAFRTRYDSSVIFEDRISWDSRTWEITGIVPDGLKREMVITGRTVN